MKWPCRLLISRIAFKHRCLCFRDLDIGMNDWMIPELNWDDNYQPDRGKVLTPEQLEKIEKYYRYFDRDGDGITYRTYPVKIRKARILCGVPAITSTADTRKTKRNTVT